MYVCMCGVLITVQMAKWEQKVTFVSNCCVITLQFQPAQPSAFYFVSDIPLLPRSTHMCHMFYCKVTESKETWCKQGELVTCNNPSKKHSHV